MESIRVKQDVQTLRDGLGELPEPVAKPVLIVVSGLPGTGKSYFSRRLAEDLPSVVLESDALRKRLVESPRYTASESNRLFDACHVLIEELLSRGLSVILDATNLVENHRERLYKIADRVGVRLTLVWVKATPELVEERLAVRARDDNRLDSSDADLSVYKAMRGRMERIGRNHIVVDTSQDIEPGVRKVLREARR
jgi:predicted kinase